MKRVVSSIASSLSLAALAAGAGAQGFTPGNLLATQGTYLIECTTTGSVVRTVPIPHPQLGAPVFVGDVVVDDLGRAHVINLGITTIDYLSTFDPYTGSWSHRAIFPAGVGVNRRDLSILGSRLFTNREVVDLRDGSIRAVVLDGCAPGEVGGGLDGKLYGLGAGSLAYQVCAIEPGTLDVLASFTLAGSPRASGITADRDGDLYVATEDGEVIHFAPGGLTVRGSIDLGSQSWYDIDLGADGVLVCGDRSGRVVVTDTALSNPSVFELRVDALGGVYVAIVPENSPKVFGVTPRSGSWRESTPVTISGRFFESAEAIEGVSFDGVPATDVVVVDDATIRCTAPAGVPGTVRVTVSTREHDASLERGFAHRPAVAVEGVPSPGSRIELIASTERPGDFLLVLVDAGPPRSISVPGIDFDLCLALPIGLFGSPSWALPELRITLGIPANPSLTGQQFLFQSLSGLLSLQRATWSSCHPIEIQP